MGTNQQDLGLLNLPLPVACGSSNGEIENVADKTPVQSGHGGDSKSINSQGEFASGLHKKPDLILAEGSELNTGNENVIEQEKEPSLESCAGPEQLVQPAFMFAAAGVKAKKSKLDRLQELGVDLTIKPRICSGDTFINLEEPLSNPGMVPVCKDLAYYIYLMVSAIY